MIVCENCGQEKPHKAHGLCNTCYQSWYREQNPQPSVPAVIDGLNHLLGRWGLECGYKRGEVWVKRGSELWVIKLRS